MMSFMYKCESCGAEVHPTTCWVRVTGWGKAAKTGVKELIQTSMPHGYLCEACGFDLKNGKEVQKRQQGSIF